MTVHPEMRYTCDRCNEADVLSIQNGPPEIRTAGPNGWAVLRIGSDPSTPPSHLCPRCNIEFGKFMDGEKLHEREGSGA